MKKNIILATLGYVFLLIILYLSVSLGNNTTSIVAWNFDSRVGAGILLFVLSGIYALSMMMIISENDD